MAFIIFTISIVLLIYFCLILHVWTPLKTCPTAVLVCLLYTKGNIHASDIERVDIESQDIDLILHPLATPFILMPNKTTVPANIMADQNTYITKLAFYTSLEYLFLFN